MKILTLAGTRPELIKLSEIIRKFDECVPHVFVHTGQNYDKNLNDIFYDDLDLRKPDYNFGLGEATLGGNLAKLMQETEKVLQAEKPDAVVILGDTNSALASIIVKRRKIPLFHLEAGNRCFDDNVPEEINRRLIDHISDVNLCYSENSRRNLLDEGLSASRVYLMGSPMNEVLQRQSAKIAKSRVLKDLGLKKGKFYLASFHRQENLEQNLLKLAITVNLLKNATQSPVVVSLHPHTRQKNLKFESGVVIHEPFNFTDYCKLQTSATCVLSDSGTLSEEAALLNFPAVILRTTTERPEAIETGSITLGGLAPVDVINAVSLSRKPNSIPQDYLVENCSERVLKIVLGYTPYIRKYVYHESV